MRTDTRRKAMLTCLAAILALLLAQDVAPQVVRHVSPELVREAIAKGSGPEAEIIQPLTITSTTQTWQSGLGRTLQSHGVRATFPMEVLIPGNEFRVVFANGRESVEKMTDEFLSKIR